MFWFLLICVSKRKTSYKYRKKNDARSGNGTRDLRLVHYPSAIKSPPNVNFVLFPQTKTLYDVLISFNMFKQMKYNHKYRKKIDDRSGNRTRHLSHVTDVHCLSATQKPNIGCTLKLTWNVLLPTYMEFLIEYTYVRK